jgi:hypothetical protein
MDCPSLCTNVRRQDRARLGGELDVLLPLHGIYSDCAGLTATIFSSRPRPAAFLSVLLLHPLISLPPRFSLLVGFRNTRVP